MTPEGILSTFNYIRNESDVTYDKTVSYIESLSEDKTIAKYLLNTFIDACYQFLLIDDKTFDKLKEKILQTNNFDVMLDNVMAVIGLYIKKYDLQELFKVLHEVDGISDIQKEIDQIDSEIQAITDQFVKYPDGADSEVKEAIDMYNERSFGVQLADLGIRKEELEKVLFLLQDNSN